MSRTVLALLLACLVMPSTLFAADPPVTSAARAVVPSAGPGDGPLAAAGRREAARLARAPEEGATPQAQESEVQRPGWISRHPALFGTVVGAGAGAIMAGTMENELFCSGGDEDCLVHGGGRVLSGAGLGAGVGAVTGLLVGALRHDVRPSPVAAPGSAVFRSRSAQAAGEDTRHRRNVAQWIGLAAGVAGAAAYWANTNCRYGSDSGGAIVAQCVAPSAAMITGGWYIGRLIGRARAAGE